MTQPSDDLNTRATLLLRLNSKEAEPREIAWTEFRDRYAPVVAGFARNCGARPGDVDDIIQDVMMGFFARSPNFVYDPSKGRFRGYLKTCTVHAIRKKMGAQAKLKVVSLDALDPNNVEVEQSWCEVWENEQLERAMELTRDAIGVSSPAYKAFRLHVVLGWPAEEVAKRLKVDVPAVHAAKERVTDILRTKLSELQDAEG
jgi:RNA polymerase sigma-70 factor, ECF subfamily